MELSANLGEVLFEEAFTSIWLQALRNQCPRLAERSRGDQNALRDTEHRRVLTLFPATSESQRFSQGARLDPIPSHSLEMVRHLLDIHVARIHFDGILGPGERRVTP